MMLYRIWYEYLPYGFRWIAAPKPRLDYEPFTPYYQNERILTSEDLKYKELTQGRLERLHRLGEREIPRGPGGGMLINYLGLPGSVTQYSYADVVDDANTDIGDWDMDYFEDLRREGRFEGRIVLIGSTVPEHQDLYPTPFREIVGAAQSVPTAGVEIHANAVATILSQDFIEPVPRPIQYAWTLLLGLFVTSLAPKVRGMWGLGVAAMLALVAVFAAWQMFPDLAKRSDGYYEAQDSFGIPLMFSIKATKSR